MAEPRGLILYQIAGIYILQAGPYNFIQAGILLAFSFFSTVLNFKNLFYVYCTGSSLL